jgi:hypothetical protein
VIGLMTAQHVVDEIGRDRHLAHVLFRAGSTALDQSRNDGALPECPLHQRRFGEPGFKVIAQHVLIEQPRERQLAIADCEGRIAQSPDRKRMFVGDETERTQTRTFEPPGQQHAERLVGEPAFERRLRPFAFGRCRATRDAA